MPSMDNNKRRSKYFGLIYIGISWLVFIMAGYHFYLHLLKNDFKSVIFDAVMVILMFINTWGLVIVYIIKYGERGNISKRLDCNIKSVSDQTPTESNTSNIMGDKSHEKL
jgi:hypothetical protein